MRTTVRRHVRKVSRGYTPVVRHARTVPATHGKREFVKDDVKVSDEERELELFIDNDGDLYRQRTVPIEKNLLLKKKKGVYDKEKAVKLWMYLVDDGAKKYAREYSIGKDWNVIFPRSSRLKVARSLADNFDREYNLGYRLPSDKG